MWIKDPLQDKYYRYYEECNQMMYISADDDFEKKLYWVEGLLAPSKNSYWRKLFINMSGSDFAIYRIRDVYWSDNIVDRMKNHLYPSMFFIGFINHLIVINSIILNPLIRTTVLAEFHDIMLNRNQLLIIDALMINGSKPVYPSNDKYIYSEHSGAIKISNYTVTQIIISAQTNRISPGDSNIYLPVHMPNDMEFEYIFHTHPNNSFPGARIKDGILYEFPSANDIYNFMNHYNGGNTLGSLIVAPEGMYLIRPYAYGKVKYRISKRAHKSLAKYISDLEIKAIRALKNLLEGLTYEVFYNIVAMNFDAINSLNGHLKSSNIYIEYYPRTWNHDIKSWVLNPIYLKIIGLQKIY
jgi:hypothetical protein